MNVQSSITIALAPEDIRAAIASYVNRRWSNRIAVFARPEDVALRALLPLYGSNVTAEVTMVFNEAVPPALIDG